MSRFVFAEVECRGMEHIGFNAAMIRTCQLAEPCAEIVLFAEREHGQFVNQRLVADRAPVVGLIDISVLSASLPAVRRFIRTLAICHRVLTYAREVHARLVAFNCVGGITLVTLKLLLRIFSELRVVGCMHGELGALLVGDPRRPWNRALRMRKALAYPPADNLTLVVLGESIKRELEKILPNDRNRWACIDHPYLALPAGLLKAPSVRPMQFGLLGVSEKGFDAYRRVAAAVKARHPDSVFKLIGFMGNRKLGTDTVPELDGISEVPLALEDYWSRIRSLTYSVWIGSPSHYSLTASASFLDALMGGKPLVALRNPYLSHYFAQFGDIGYLCDSEAHIVECISALLSDPPDDHYREQVKNLAAGRDTFFPENVAGKFLKIVSDVHRNDFGAAQRTLERNRNVRLSP